MFFDVRVISIKLKKLEKRQLEISISMIDVNIDLSYVRGNVKLSYNKLQETFLVILNKNLY